MSEASGGPADRSWAVPVIGVLVVVVVLSAAGGGLLLLASMGTCACSPTPPPVDADASVATGEGNVTVTYDRGHGVEHLLIEWRVDDGSVHTTGASENVSVGNGSARLPAPGTELTLSEGNRTTDTRVTIVVRAQGYASKPTIYEGTVTL